MTVALISKTRNEAHCIARMLESVKELFGDELVGWLIHDTGSTDNTIEIIEQTMAGIPGKVERQPWYDFGTNNTLLLEAAREVLDADWLVLVDADITLEGVWSEPAGDANALNVTIKIPRMQWQLPLITKRDFPFRYEGRAHEYLASEQTISYGQTEVIFRHHSDGDSSGSAQRNLDLLLGQKTYTPRDMFYIAQSYSELNQQEHALEWYTLHAQTGDFVEEVFISKLRIGLIKQSVEALLEAWDYRPSRAEPLYEAIVLLNQRHQYRTAWALGAMALQIPYPKSDQLFIQDHVYEYDLLYQASIACDYVDRPQAIEMFKQILAIPDIPDYVQIWTRNNLSSALLQSKGDS